MSERIAEERLKALQSVTDAALSLLPLEQMLTELLSRVTGLVDADTAAILLLDDDGRTLVARAAKGLEEEVEREVRIPVGRGFAGRIARERTPVTIANVDTADVFNPILREKKLKSLLGVPMMVETRLIGVMHVGSLTPRDFTADDAEVLERAADRAALAVGMRFAERERGLADAFQRSLMPPLPVIPGVSLAGRYKPAEEAQLGGDWYDAFVLPTGAIGVAIGDVVGRGFHAAALMGQLRAALRAFALDQESPASVLERLSGLLRQLEPGLGATVIYALVEPHAGKATVARAGHLPPIAIDEHDSVTYVDLPRTVPLGAVRFPIYEDTEVALGTPATLILYTDGLIERPGEPLDAGFERLHEALDGSERDPQRVCDLLVRTLLPSGAGGDDAALVVVTVPPLADPMILTMPADPDSITLIRRVVGRWLTQAGATEEELGEITLACSEACANAIEHAYGPDATEFEVEAASGRDGVTVTVRDKGQWREPRGTNRGRGLTLMRGLVDEVDLRPGDTGTAIHLTRRLGRLAA